MANCGAKRPHPFPGGAGDDHEDTEHTRTSGDWEASRRYPRASSGTADAGMPIITAVASFATNAGVSIGKGAARQAARDREAGA